MSRLNAEENTGFEAGKNPENIVLFATGGTFDKEYNEIEGTLDFRSSHIEPMLALGRCRLPVRVEVLMLKDSLEMDQHDRKLIEQACVHAPESRIMITHGTDTMSDTAYFLSQRIRDKTIVLTGAMIPYSFGSSDGLFNFGSALSFVQILGPGVYVAMNGRLFPGDRVVKDRKAGIFCLRSEQNESGKSSSRN